MLGALICLLSIISMDLQAQDVSIPDTNFLNTLIAEGVDLNGDGIIQQSEAHAVTELVFSIQCSSLEGIEHFINLNKLNIRNSIIDSLKFNLFPSLEVLSLLSIQSEFLELDSLPSLNSLGLSYLGLTEIDFSFFPKLNHLYLADDISEVDLSPLQNVTTIEFENLPLATLNLDVVPSLIELYLYEMDIYLDLTALENIELVDVSDVSQPDLDLSNNSKLKTLSIQFNDIKYLDASCCPQLSSCDFPETVEYIFLGSEIEDIYVSELDHLRYICVLESQWQEVENQRDYYGLFFQLESNCFYSTDCKSAALFIENDQFVRPDNCDISNPNTIGMSLRVISDSIDLIYQINADQTTNQFNGFALPYDTYKVIPIINSSHIANISPDTVLLSLDSINPFDTEFFCIEFEELVDLESHIIPLNLSRPGFESSYRIVVSNRGSLTTSGSLVFYFQDSLMEFQSANPMPHELLNNTLTWAVNDLEPNNSRIFNVTFTLNSPNDSPPLVGGEQLMLRSDIETQVTDNIVANNEFMLRQTIVNSYDPNDKKCLEGDFISVDEIDNYLHFLIRFENLGTASAVNIIVSDTIDTEKFDLSTFASVDASHSFYTRVSRENVIDFIFENINLPFDDSSNDGFVMYKITPEPTIAVGDTLFNSASIYFDYNQPIITNTTKTVVMEDNSLINNRSKVSPIKIYPMPLGDVLNIVSKYEIVECEIRSLEGHLLLSEKLYGNTSQVSLDIKNMVKGLYLLKLKTEQEEFIEKIIVQ